MTVLTADLCARAVIAAARSYGDDPVAAAQARGGVQLRRGLTAAAGGLNRAGVAFDLLDRVLGVKKSTIRSCRSKKPWGYLPAELMALRAVQYAGWRAGWSPVAMEPPCNPSSEPLRGPPSPARGEGARTMAAGAVRREVLACLAEAPSKGPELMDLVGVGEGQIRSALSGLVDEGRVVGTKLTAEGWGARTWSVRA